MTHLYIKICDLCGNPAEAGSQMHAGHLTTDIIVRTSKKFSTSIFREEFDICIDCLNKTGLYKILFKMREQKNRNKNKEKKVKKFVKFYQKQIEKAEE